MSERADVRVRDDDLGGELDIERLLDRERDPFCLPLRPEAEVVGVAPIREPHYVFIFARLRDERGVRVEAEGDDVHQALADAVEIKRAGLVHYGRVHENANEHQQSGGGEGGGKKKRTHRRSRTDRRGP